MGAFGNGFGTAERKLGREEMKGIGERHGVLGNSPLRENKVSTGCFCSKNILCKPSSDQNYQITCKRFKCVHITELC